MKLESYWLFSSIFLMFSYIRRRSQISLVSVPDRSDFCSKVRIGWSASIKTKKKLKGRFISISHLLVIEISIFLTWDNFKGYVPTESNLELLWQWLAAWKPSKLGSHVSWRGLCVFVIICCSRYLKLVVVFPKHFTCHATETVLKIEPAEFQHKSANKFSQKVSVKLKTIS